jgi:DNA invertase Pin-like site-specific DNA recombinase
MNTTKPTKRAVIYCRANDKRCLKDLAFQEARCREYARANGYEVLKVVTEISRKEFWHRDGFHELLSFCAPEKNNSIEALIAPNMEVLAQDDPLQLSTIIEQLALKKVEIKLSTRDQFISDLLRE